MELRNAKVEDVEDVLSFHSRYHVDSIEEAKKEDGFVTTAFTAEQIIDLIEREDGLSIAVKDGQVVAYVMAASWEFWSQWPMFAHMVEGLSRLSFGGHRLSVENSYQYGPVCVDERMRGQGVFEQIFGYSLRQWSARYPVLVTFVNKNNPRSLAAHIGKVGLEVVYEFEYNDNEYYELACQTGGF